MWALVSTACAACVLARASGGDSLGRAVDLSNMANGAAVQFGRPAPIRVKVMLRSCQLRLSLLTNPDRQSRGQVRTVTPSTTCGPCANAIWTWLMGLVRAAKPLPGQSGHGRGVHPMLCNERSFLSPTLEQVPGNDQPLNLAGSVKNPERPAMAKKTLHGRSTHDPQSTKNLHRLVDHIEGGFCRV
jgi:hypothetical protein